VGELSCSFVTSGSHLTAGRVFDANQSGWTSRNIVNKPEKSNMALGAECRLNPRRLPDDRATRSCVQRFAVPELRCSLINAGACQKPKRRLCATATATSTAATPTAATATSTPGWVFRLNQAVQSRSSWCHVVGKLVRLPPGIMVVERGRGKGGGFCTQIAIIKIKAVTKL